MHKVTKFIGMCATGKGRECPSHPTRPVVVAQAQKQASSRKHCYPFHNQTQKPGSSVHRPSGGKRVCRATVAGVVTTGAAPPRPKPTAPTTTQPSFKDSPHHKHAPAHSIKFRVAPLSYLRGASRNSVTHSFLHRSLSTPHLWCLFVVVCMKRISKRISNTTADIRNLVQKARHEAAEFRFEYGYEVRAEKVQTTTHPGFLKAPALVSKVPNESFQSS